MEVFANRRQWRFAAADGPVPGALSDGGALRPSELGSNAPGIGPLVVRALLSGSEIS